MENLSTCQKSVEICAIHAIGTFGRNDGCSNITELLRNFWIRQSRPWIASNIINSMHYAPGTVLTGVGDFGNLVAVEAVPISPVRKRK